MMIAFVFWASPLMEGGREEVARKDGEEELQVDAEMGAEAVEDLFACEVIAPWRAVRLCVAFAGCETGF